MSGLIQYTNAFAGKNIMLFNLNIKESVAGVRNGQLASGICRKSEQNKQKENCEN